MPPPFFYWSFGPQICNDSVLLVQLRLSDLFLVRRPAHKSPRTVQAVAAARPAICRANKLNAVSYSGSSPGAVTSHVVDTTTVNSPIAKAIRRTNEIVWSDLWTARGTSSSRALEVVSMKPRNTSSSPAKVAEAPKSAVITSWWLMPPRLHRGRSSIHQNERLFGPPKSSERPRPSRAKVALRISAGCDRGQQGPVGLARVEQ